MDIIKNLFNKKDPAPADPKALNEAEAAGDVIISPDVRREQRIPPGQSRTLKWPVLHAGGVPRVNPATWDFRVRGLVDRPIKFSYDEFLKLPTVKVLSDFHCVTRWSRLDNLWEGVATRLIAERAGIKPEAKFAIVLAEEGWTTNMPIEDFLAEDALFAYNHDGEPLAADHGGPIRLVVPRLYAWKSAKWVRGVEFRETDQPGFWEDGGYHNHGDPWTEERFYWS
jgi:DMSO/TMAO reductase YedYZ molybdopterin-dependent catalytic subunit